GRGRDSFGEHNLPGGGGLEQLAIRRGEEGEGKALEGLEAHDDGLGVEFGAGGGGGGAGVGRGGGFFAGLVWGFLFEAEGGDVVEVDEGDVLLLGDFLAPFDEVVADAGAVEFVVFGPAVVGDHGEEDRRCAVFFGFFDVEANVPAVGVD